MGMQLGVVAPSALPGFAKLPGSCTSLDIHGDHWDMPLLGDAQLNHLTHLRLKHLGIFHFSLGPEEQEGEEPSCSGAQRLSIDALLPLQGS